MTIETISTARIKASPRTIGRHRSEVKDRMIEFQKVPQSKGSKLPIRAMIGTKPRSARKTIIALTGSSQ